MKIKTGSKNSKIGTPRIERVAKPIPEKKEKLPEIVKKEVEVIPTWVRESSEKKPKRTEGSESKLQWRKETKKSQRSFSKNKEREYIKSRSESVPSDARGGFRNTFDKAATYEGEVRQSNGDPQSKKSGKGFEKSKTGYKGVGSAWDKSTVPRVSTRTWDDVGDKPVRATDAPKRVYTKGASTKTTPSKVAKEEYKKPKYIAPKPSWEKETEIVDKKKLIDPTK